jgi:phosphoglycerate kinase
MRFLDSLDLKGKKLIIRVDYNVPIKDGRIADDIRIRESLPTIKLALDSGAAVILCAHFGRPKDKPEPEFSLAPTAAHLAKLIGREVLMAKDTVGPDAKAKAAALSPGQILMLENLRFQPGEAKNDPEFAKELASMADIYVNDAFGVAHRPAASVVALPLAAKVCCGGLLLKKEWQYLGETLSNPERPYVAISGGAKVSSKLAILKRLLDKVDTLIIGGAMANTFLLAQGHSVGASLAEADLKGEAKSILDAAKAKGVTICLPLDVVLGKSLEDETAGAPVDVANVPAEAMILDIGPKTVAAYEKALAGAKTVMWNGPMGAFENPAFAAGSVAVAKAVAALPGAVTIVGGGDTDALIHKSGVAGKFSFISTGGGSFLEFLEGKELPAFKALKECSK